MPMIAGMGEGLRRARVILRFSSSLRSPASRLCFPFFLQSTVYSLQPTVCFPCPFRPRLTILGKSQASHGGWMNDNGQDAHKGFLRRSGIYIGLSAFTSIFELGFNSAAVRLPEGSYETLWALLKIFFIITAPLTAVQLVVSKETAANGVLGDYGRRRRFVGLTLEYAAYLVTVMVVAGLMLSGWIAGLLRMDNPLPVYLLFGIIAVYFPIPILFGVVQGLKKFNSLALLQISWGAFRFVAAIIIVWLLAQGIVPLFFGIFIATILTALLAFRAAMPVFRHPLTPISRTEMARGYSLILPVVITLVCVTVLKNIDVVFAKRFFDPVAAKAYANGAFFGSAFFMLTGIFMVMFPIVSEENTRGGDPIMLLLKACGFVSVLSVAGILIALLFPALPMFIINGGAAVPGAIPLVRIFGIAVLPISLVNIISNYFLAKHEWGFVPILIAGAGLQTVMILTRHANPFDMLTGIAVVNWILFGAMGVYSVMKQRVTAIKNM